MVKCYNQVEYLYQTLYSCMYWSMQPYISVCIYIYMLYPFQMLTLFIGHLSINFILPINETIDYKVGITIFYKYYKAIHL